MTALLNPIRENAAAFVDHDRFSSRGAKQNEMGFASSCDDEWDGMESQLRRIRMYHDDWDGEGSPAPLAATVDRAIGWLSYVRRLDGVLPPGRVSSTPNGSICFEWYDNGNLMEIEITSPMTIEGRIVGIDGVVQAFIPIGAPRIGSCF